jgi:hypothetical protein
MMTSTDLDAGGAGELELGDVLSRARSRDRDEEARSPSPTSGSGRAGEVVLEDPGADSRSRSAG